MAVFPDRIVLKNSTDSQATIEAAIAPGGSDPITQGEIVIGLESNAASFYTIDGTGNVVKIGSANSGVVNLGDLLDVDLSTPATNGQVIAYNSTSGNWEPGNQSGGLANIVEDTTPQLGGNLDVSGYYITSASGGDVTIAPDTTGDFIVRGNSTDGSITLNCTANTHGVTIQSPPHADAATYTLILPSGAGTAGQVLTSQGGAQLTWEDAASGGGGGTSTFVQSDGGLAEFPLAGIDGFYATQAAMEADGWTLIANSADADDQALDFDPGAQWDGIDFLGNGILSGGDWFINTNGGVGWDLTSSSTADRNGNALTAAASIDFYVSWWSQDTESRVSGFKEVTEYGRLYLVVRSDQRVPYSSSSDGFPVEVWFGEEGSVSVRYGTKVGTGADIIVGANRNVIVSNGVAISTNPYPNLPVTGAYAYSYAQPYNLLGNLEDVDTTGATDGQVLAYVAANSQWEPITPAPGGVTSIIAGDNITIDQSTGDVTISATGGGGGNGGIAGTILQKEETQTASAGAATFTELGESGLLVSISTTADAWVVLYPTAADRAADASRGYGVDPAPGSGVLAEFYVTTSGAVLASPGTTYFNNDTASTSALYAAVRDQAGANVAADITIKAYVHQGFGGVGTARATDSGTATSGLLTLTGMGQAGQFCTVTSSLDAWVVFYGSDADRTADSARAFATDPAPGSGVQAEFYIAAGTTVLATPGSTYFNNDTNPTDAMYLAVRDQVGSATNSLITVTVYAETSYTGISGGTFGSG